MDLSITAVRSRIEAISPVLEKIQENTRTASISIGVLHQGDIIYTRNTGIRNASSQETANEETTYLLASVTKAFIASCCGILVDEGKLKWSDPLQKHISFQNKSDPLIGQRATIQDALSHSTGLAHLDLSWLGIEGQSLVDKKDLLEIVSNLPALHDLRGGFHYNNYMYAVAGSLIESKAGIPWNEFLRDRILQPLDMLRTTTSRESLPDQNLAEPHVVLDDRSLCKLNPVDVADDTIMGSAGGVWSCVPDMMKWSKALLDAMHETTEPSSPLRQVSTIVSHKASITTSSLGENTYALGFARAMIPSTELGILSLNGPQRTNIIGRSSPPRLVLYHNGGQSGYLSAFYLFPETRTAIVALGNSYGLGDGPDWSAQALTQAIFDLGPRIDFDVASRQRANTEYERYQCLSDELEYHRNREQQGDSSSSDLAGFIGIYKNSGLRMTLEITLGDDNVLRLIINKLASQHHQLRYFGLHKLSFLPASREELVVRQFIDWFRWDQFVLSFRHAEESDTIVGVDWAMQVGLSPVHFTKH